MNYPLSHFDIYATLVFREMENRGYKPNYEKFSRYISNTTETISVNDLFSGWHNDKYLRQCFYNLQEKYDCGQIKPEEWREIEVICRYKNVISYYETTELTHGICV